MFTKRRKKDNEKGSLSNYIYLLYMQPIDIVYFMDILMIS